MCDYFALCCGLRRSLGLLRLRGHLRRVLVHCGDGTFDPAGFITREELVTMI